MHARDYTRENKVRGRCCLSSRVRIFGHDVVEKRK